MLRRVNEPASPSADADAEVLLYEGSPAALPSFGALALTIITLGLALLFFWPRSRATRYRITNQRVVVESGLFSKRMEQVDTYRIHDYVVERPLGQRIMGTGNISLLTQDRTTPAVRLDGLSTDVVALYEKLRKATEQQKRLRGVRVLDSDHTP